MTAFDLETTDRLLSTTRAVRRRLDFDRPVARETILNCLDLATQAPTGSNRQGWRFVVVTDARKRAALADLYRRGASGYLSEAYTAASARGETQNALVFSSAQYLAENLQRVPVHLIPCIEADIPPSPPVTLWPGLMGSIFPAVWSFQLALRARGLGSCLTTLHLRYAAEAADLLGIPAEVMQVGLLPVAYTKGTDFRPAVRPPAQTVTHWDSWGQH